MTKKIFLLFLSVFLLAGASSAQEEKKYDIVVSRDGNGDFRTIQEAIHSVRAFKPEGRTTILIKNGIYKEKLIVPTWVENISLIGEDAQKTIITWDDHAKIDNMGTFKTYTLLVQGDGFEAYNLTIENNAAQLGQAVSLHVEADRVIFKNCRLLGNQDTVYLGKGNFRQYFENCYIEGTTDFIFGPSTAWFENCDIYCKKNSYITAASTPENVTYGFIFNNCRITAAPQITKVYLGRPWRAYAATLFMNCSLDRNIVPAGWDNWRNPENEKTARYAEYNNSGEGAATSQRVKWIKILNKKEAADYTVKNVLKGWDNWNPVQ